VKQIKKRLTYANVMSSIAVFLVLGGGAAIAAGLAKNSVGSKQLKKNAVTAAKIKKNAVTGAKVKAGSLTASNFAAGQLPVGPKGDKGATGAPGPSFGAFGNGGCGELEKDAEPFEEEDAYESCASTGSVNLPSAGNVLLIASAEWDNDDKGGTPPNSGQCRLSVDGTPIPRDISFGELTNTHGIGEGGSISMNRITTPLSAGSHTFAFECREIAGSVFISEAMLSAVLLGSASVQAMLPLP
jgi:hypothetical protein